MHMGSRTITATALLGLLCALGFYNARRYLDNNKAEKMLSSETAESWHFRFFKNDEVEKVLPKAPDWYPDNLKGILWMDQNGVYGVGSVGEDLPSLCVSIGDTSKGTLNLHTRSIRSDPLGPGWQLANNAKGYVSFIEGKPFHFFYDFEFNEDYTFAQIYPVVFGKRVSKKIMNFTMVRQVPPEGACPPRPGTPREDIVKCATWKRYTSVMGSVPGLSHKIGEHIYYAYEIVDKDGNRRQPYYDAYLDWANSQCKPEKRSAMMRGIRLSEIGQQPGTSFVMTR